ncbi:MAG: RluA family pseudouridine synthase [Holophagaceae bacterium]|nr:RluA family pseudouridine synthase [Holophagaceae bacterium]
MSLQIKSWSAEVGGVALSGELHRILGVSHRQAKGLIDSGCVNVNGELARVYGARLGAGDEVVVNFDAETNYNQVPRRKISDSVIKILWEDSHLVFVDKPAGLLSVPTEHSDDNTLADALAEHYRQTGIKRPHIYIAHRLDRYTTGVLVFAKTPEALNGLRDLFHDHQINRVYRAILVGELPENIGSLHDKLAERTRKIKMAVVAKRSGSAKPQGTKVAVTHYRVIERLPGHTVVELKLETGRRNQIRVQFAERGYPLLGDHIYGKTSPIIDRQALHAEILGLKHPITGENITVQSRIPEDMEGALKKLRATRRVARAKASIKGEEGIFKPKITKERKQERISRALRYAKDETPPRRFQDSDPPRRSAPSMNRGRPQPAKGEEHTSRPRREGSKNGSPRSNSLSHSPKQFPSKKNDSERTKRIGSATSEKHLSRRPKNDSFSKTDNQHRTSTKNIVGRPGRGKNTKPRTGQPSSFRKRKP